MRAAVAALGCSAALIPAAASAATVDVRTDASSHTMKFTAGAGETNTVTVGVVQIGNPNVYEISDATAPLTAGEGCTGGGPPGSTATCTVPASTFPCPVRGCPTSYTTAIDVDLGDGDDSLDSTAIPVRDGGPGSFRMIGRGGPGADLITDGEANGSFYPGDGADRVLAGAGADAIHTGAATPDGPDVYDLGPGFGLIDYGAATYDVTISLDDVANDGGPGEGDQIIGAASAAGGSGDDTIIDPHSVASIINGRAGDDELTGGDGVDSLYGDGGDDLIRGLGGNDSLVGDEGGIVQTSPPEPAGDDDLRGGAGNDDLEGEKGRDRLSGGSGADRLAGNGGVLRDGDRDTLDCGSGRDRRAFVAKEDTVRRCEVVKNY